MYSKIAFKNVKKSFSDYMIYFLTLTFAVCIFYSFNSIESQQAMFEVNSSKADYAKMLVQIISVVSVFVSFILGGLIVYANNFLIKKRKKELGIYMTLGMGKNKISMILVIETFFIGLMALISGLILGIIMSQGLSLLATNLFELGMQQYHFVISIKAILKTTLYFGLIFMIVVLFNTVIISKYKLIDLLTASKKNEEIKIKSSKLVSLIFTLSLVLIGISYVLIQKAGLDISNQIFYMAVGFGVVGTYTFFYSLANFMIGTLKHSKKIYLKELNLFVVKQISSKANTHFVSMGTICLMLFVTIGMLSTGFAVKDVIEEGLAQGTPFDASGVMYNIAENDPVQSIKESFDKVDFKFENGENYHFYYGYSIDTTVKELLDPYADRETKEMIEHLDIPIMILKLSDYNRMLEMKMKKPISLKQDEVLVASNMKKYEKAVENFMKQVKQIKIGDRNLKINNTKVIKEQFQTAGLENNILTFIIPDNIEDLVPKIAYLNVNYDQKHREVSEQSLQTLFTGYKEGKIKYKDAGFVIGSTKQEFYEMNQGVTTVVLFIGIYIGIIFLLSSAAILALQQLSEAGDSIERYKVLKKIGSSDKMINKTIFIQTLTYFMLPLGVAFIHSIVGISVVNQVLSTFNKPNIIIPSLITAFILMVIYGGYFLATYFSYKQIIKNN